MVSAKALIFQDKKTHSLLHTSDADRPLGVQIFGSDPETIGEAAVRALDLSGADFIDINMGCPVGKIVKSGDGAALMREPKRAEAVFIAVRRAVRTQIPVTAKIRKGWDKGSVNAIEFAKMLEGAGAAAITVHGRTKVQMYSGVADWDIIRAVKHAVTIPVIANGDVFSGSDCAKILERTGADMVMVGRGAFGNPWLFRDGNAVLNGQNLPKPPTLEERVNVAKQQIKMAIVQKGEKIGCFEARKHLAWYLSEIPHSAKMRQAVNQIQNIEALERTLENILQTARFTHG